MKRRPDLKMSPILRPRPIRKKQASEDNVQILQQTAPNMRQSTRSRDISKRRKSVVIKQKTALPEDDWNREQQIAGPAEGTENDSNDLKAQSLEAGAPEWAQELPKYQDAESCGSTRSYIIIENSDNSARSIIEKCISVLEKHGVAFCRKYCHCSLSTLIKNELILHDARLYLLELESKMYPTSPANSEEIDYDFMETFLLDLLDADSWYSRLYLQSAERIETLHTRIFALEVEMLPFAERGPL